MKNNQTEHQRTVERIKNELAPIRPCIHVDADGYCTGCNQGALCVKCADYTAMTKEEQIQLQAKSSKLQTPSALTVRLGEIAFPEGVETLGEKANWLHRCSVEFSKKSTGAAILAGWVLSVARSTCAHGQWLGWLEANVSFNIRTAQNYMSLYAQTLGAARAAARRPVALTVEPTADELEAAAHDVDGKALSALYKSTRLMSTSENWGGANRGQGRKPKDVAAELEAITEHEAVLWTSAKGALDTLVQLDSKKDVLRRLSDDHLVVVAGILADLSTKAAKTLEKRLSNHVNPV